MSKNSGYNEQRLLHWSLSFVPKKKTQDLAGFGARLAQLRKAAGYTQLELADEVGVSRRVIAYYEGETQHPPTTLLPKLAEALGISTDELLDVNFNKKKLPKTDSRLLRRLQQIEKLGAKEKRQVLQLLDTFIEHERLKRRVGDER